MFAFLCTRLGKRGKTQSSRFWICFCFYLTLFLLCDGSMSGKLGSQHQLFKIIVWIIFSFKWYETVVRNEHLFMLTKWVFRSIHLFWLYILVHVIAQNVRFFRVITWPNSALCVHLRLVTASKKRCFCCKWGRREGRPKLFLAPREKNHPKPHPFSFPPQKFGLHL